MLRIYKVEKEKFKEAKKVIEANPYEKDSFAMAGYKLREGKALNMDFDGYYLHVEASEEAIKKFDEKLKDLATPLEGEEFERVKKAFEEEEESAQQGFGNLFG